MQSFLRGKRTKFALAGVDRALKLAPDSTNAQAFAALALSRLGNFRRAEELAATVQKAAPLDTALEKMVLPVARSLADLEQRQPALAVPELQTVEPYDFSRSLIAESAYYRGFAYLEMKDAAKASAEFHKLLAHSAVRPNSPYIALSEYGLARAFDVQGNTSGARAAYQKFFSLWKDGDADVPSLREARVEYTRLEAREAHMTVAASHGSH